MLRELSILAGSPITLLYAVGLMISGAGIVGEATYSALLRRRLYTWRDTLANLVMYGGYVVLNLWWAHLIFAIYTWTSHHALVHLTVGGWHLGQHGLWWEWVALIVAEDLCFYVFHRASHRIRLLWASHVTHHSSQQFNLSVAFRQTWLPFAGVIFWLPLMLVGFDPLMVMSVQVISLFYQELLHTQLVPSLGPIEWIMNTPRHHALHHASNTPYLDKNYGGVFIIWDRLFGSFARRQASEPARFGLTKNLRSHNPVVIAGHELGAIARDVVRRPLGALGAIFGPPR
jgi:sterol desaturase/sphingolipid hydroxylase (fatty acid hydroxylase superfamily)